MHVVLKIKDLEDVIILTKKGKPVQPKTLGQKEYVELIRNNDITFGIGPAGTGKTYLAVAMAVRAFKSGSAFNRRYHSDLYDGYQTSGH